MRPGKWILIAGILSMATASHARFGVGVTMGSSEMDGDDLDAHEQQAMKSGVFVAPFQVSVDKDKFSGELELFYEGKLVKDLDWGVRAGYWASPKSTLDEKYSIFNPHDSGNQVENKATSFPVSVYLRKQLPPQRLSLVGGAGYEHIKAETKFRFWDPADTLDGTFKDKKWAPFFHLGVDYKLHSLCSIGLNLKYLFSAKMDNFKGTPRSSYLQPGETQLVMRTDPGFGEFIDTANSQILGTGSARPYKVNFGGLRIGINARLSFGG